MVMRYTKQEILNHIKAHLNNMGDVIQDSEGTIDLNEEMRELDNFYKFIEKTLSA